MSMRDIGKQVRQLAGKYIWWQDPDRPARDARLIAQVMELGTHEDAEIVREAVGDEALRQVLQTAEPGWFSEKSWHYWHYALGMASFDQVPERPARRYA